MIVTVVGILTAIVAVGSYLLALLQELFGDQLQIQPAAA